MRRLMDRMFDGLANSRVLAAAQFEAFQFPHLVDVYRTVKLTVGADKEAMDVAYTKVLSAQICFFSATPETEVAQIQGRTKVANIFTNDKFFFPVGVVIEDDDVLKMVSALPDYQGLWWLCQGNPQAQEGYPFQVTRVQMVYAKITTAPANIV